MDFETDNVIANLNLADIYKNIYIYETKPSTKHTPEKQFVYQTFYHNLPIRLKI